MTAKKTKRRRCRAIEIHTSLNRPSGKARVQCRKKEAKPGEHLCRYHLKHVPHDVNDRGIE